jgi:hypothetical protein
MEVQVQAPSPVETCVASGRKYIDGAVLSHESDPRQEDFGGVEDVRSTANLYLVALTPGPIRIHRRKILSEDCFGGNGRDIRPLLAQEF